MRGVLIAISAALLISTSKSVSLLLNDVDIEKKFNSLYSSGRNSTQSRKFTYETSNLPDRFQWSHNYGYCGEVSLIMAGLKWGQYYSQYDIRDIAVIDPVGGKQAGGHWYNIGVNDQFTTEKVSLTSEEYTDNRVDKRDSTTKDYIAWIKKLVRKGYAVTICVFMNHYLFYLNDDANAGFHEYDHIVTVTKYESNYDDDLYHDDDIITMADHGLWAPKRSGPPYYWSYEVKSWIGSRRDANNPDGPLYTLPERKVQDNYTAITLVRNYGIAQTGLLCPDNDCIPVTVSTDVNYESPQIGIRSEDRPEPMEITLTVTIAGLENGVSYNLYKYDSETKVPKQSFNSKKASAVSSYSIVGSSGRFIMTEKIMSNQKVIYRCVRASSK